MFLKNQKGIGLYSFLIFNFDNISWGIKKILSLKNQKRL